MNFFKIKTSWSNAELIPLKLCIASAYILVGAYFHNFVKHYYAAFLALYMVTLVWAVYAWLGKMKNKNS